MAPVWIAPTRLYYPFAFVHYTSFTHNIIKKNLVNFSLKKFHHYDKTHITKDVGQVLFFVVNGRIISLQTNINTMYYVIGIIVFLLLSSLRVVKEYERGVIFFLGKCKGIRGPGLIILVPIFEQMTRVQLRTITMAIPSQKIISKDNVSIDIAAVAYYHVVDPIKATIAIENVYDAVNQISQTTVRNVVGQFQLDQLLSQTSQINLQIKNVIDEHTEPWGVQVTAVEIKDIILPDNMQRAMAKEAEAERERRAKIVAAEGEFQAAQKLGEAADLMALHPVALQLRTLQTMAEISVEKNSTIIFPAQFMTTVSEAVAMIKGDMKK